MALVKCAECGGSVSDSAPACPHCGAPAPGGGTVVITRKKAMTGFANSIEVVIDGQVGGTVGKGESVAFDVTSGNHQIEANSFGPAPTRGKHINFQLGSGQTVHFETGFHAVTGFYLKKM